MRTAYEIAMVRDKRGVWVAPWERGQARPTAEEQATSTAAEPLTHSIQDKQSWGEFLCALLLRWKGGSQHLGQQAA